MRTSCGWLPTVLVLPTLASSRSRPSTSSIFTTCACDGYDARVQRMPATVDNLQVQYVVSDDVWEGHSLVMFVGRKRMCNLCSREKWRTSQNTNVETSFVYPCKSGAYIRSNHSVRRLVGQVRNLGHVLQRPNNLLNQQCMIQISGVLYRDL